MILLDFQQVAIANLMVQLGPHQNAKLDPSLLRSMILNSIRHNRQEFLRSGELVICVDSIRSWRRDVFPYYKVNRRKEREASEIDWKLVFETINSVAMELKEFFPYRVVKVEGAEADDVIGVLVRKFATPPDQFALNNDANQIVILSGDKDFGQLQRHSDVVQFSPVRKEYIRRNEPENHLKELIIRGDKDDGIPNFLSPDDVFVTAGARQSPIMTNKVTSWLDMTPEQICGENQTMLRNWKRNEQLIDLRFTPTNIEQQILSEFDAQGGKDRKNLDRYFMHHRLPLLHACVNDF